MAIQDLTDAVDMLHELGMLARLPRSGAAFLGSEQQSVAEHSFRTAAIGEVLADLIGDSVDKLKVMQLCLFHDFGEARCGDLNGVQKRYVCVDHDRLLRDLGQCSPLHLRVARLLAEFGEQESLEAQVAADADRLELILFLKVQEERGVNRASEWIESARSGLRTDSAKELATQAINTPSDTWWQVQPSPSPHC